MKTREREIILLLHLFITLDMKIKQTAHGGLTNSLHL